MAQGPRDYLLKDFCFPYDVFRLTKNPLFFNHPTSPWLAQLLTQAHQNIDICLPPQITPTLLLRYSLQVPSGDSVSLPGVGFLHWHFYQDSTPRGRYSRLRIVYSPICFMLASSQLATPTFSKGFLYRETQTLHQVVTCQFEMFLLNWRYKTRKLPDYTKPGNYQIERLFSNPERRPGVPFQD